MIKQLILFASLLLPAISIGQSIKGTAIDGMKKIKVPFTDLFLLDSTGSVKDTATTDLEGRFLFADVTPGVYAIHSSNISYGDTLFQNIRVVHNIRLTLDVHAYCEFDKSLHDKTCPVCHKKDQSIPIRYGFPVSMDEEGEKWLSGGCDVSDCDPHWYCKRDNTEF